LITVDELRAAGALEVPSAWRKSLAKAPDRRYRSLFGDDEDEQQPASIEVRDDEPAEEAL